MGPEMDPFSVSLLVRQSVRIQESKNIRIWLE